MAIGEARDRDVAEHGGDHLDGDKPAIFLRGDAAVVHRPEDHEGVGQPFAEADEDVADEQFAQRGIEGFHDGDKGIAGRLRARGGVLRCGFFSHEPLKYRGGGAEADATEQGEPHAGFPAVPRDEPAADQRADHHRHAAHEGLHADAHGVLAAVERGGDDGHQCGQRQRAPREEQKRTDKQRQPVRPHKHEHVAREREGVEEQQRAPLAEAVGQPAAGPGVERAEESLQRVEEADDQHARAEGFEILRRETEPESLGGAREDNCDEQQRGVAPQPEEIRRPPQGVHARKSGGQATRFTFIGSRVIHFIRGTVSNSRGSVTRGVGAGRNCGRGSRCSTSGARAARPQRCHRSCGTAISVLAKVRAVHTETSGSLSSVRNGGEGAGGAPRCGGCGTHFRNDCYRPVRRLSRPAGAQRSQRRSIRWFRCASPPANFLRASGTRLWPPLHRRSCIGGNDPQASPTILQPRTPTTPT